ncbi:MAG TPA: hypothetical protein VJZ91_01915 [Blastocatellia bacterium]|nr:hypothetical protein [Blastocatellia bacterium]
MKKSSFLLRLALPALALGLISIGPALQADSGANHRVRNLHFGVSGGNVKDISRRFCCSGTLGSLVKDTTGRQFILSNNHVLGLAGSATAGDDVSQPGLIDNNCAVATVVADFTVAPALSSGVDCAIAQLRAGQMDGTGFIEDIGTISSVVKTPTVGLSVAKSGRTTGFTTGSISSTTTTVSVRYPSSCGANNGPSFTFTNQVVINSSTFSGGGDSGSLIVTNNACHQPVALLFAGSSTSTIGNPVGLVLTRLSSSLGSTVSFVGSTCSAAAVTTQSLNSELSDASVEFATEAMRAREQDLMSRPGVIGVGIGQAEDNQREAAIVVYVDSTAKVKTKLPKTISGVKVKRVYTEPFVAY